MVELHRRILEIVLKIHTNFKQQQKSIFFKTTSSSLSFNGYLLQELAELKGSKKVGTNLVTNLLTKK